MIFSLHPRDTVAWRFALTMGLAVLVMAMLMAGLLLTTRLSGYPLRRADTQSEAAGFADVLAAAAPPMRPVLARAARTPAFRLDWIPGGTPLARALDQAARRQAHGNSSVLTFDDVRLLTGTGWVPSDATFRPTETVATPLPDGSWSVFRSERLPLLPDAGERAAEVVVLGIIVVLLIALAVGPRLSRPLQSLSAAVRRFGVDLDAPAVAPSGPEELRDVVVALNVTQERIRKFVVDRMTMLAAISHDLRTPLTRMRLRGELIPDAAQREKLFRDVDEMQAMIDGALAFFRDDAGEEETTQVDIGGVLRTIVNDFADQGVPVAFEGAAKVACLGRPLSLKRAVTNLLDNAVKYGNAPSLRLEADATAIRIHVRDHGCGLPTDALEQVFIPFFRMETSRNRATGGVGLGLPTARTIVEAHGGHVDLRNHPGGGLEATITLPAFSFPRQ